MTSYYPHNKAQHINFRDCNYNMIGQLLPLLRYAHNLKSRVKVRAG